MRFDWQTNHCGPFFLSLRVRQCLLSYALPLKKKGCRTEPAPLMHARRRAFVDGNKTVVFPDSPGSFLSERMGYRTFKQCAASGTHTRLENPLLEMFKNIFVRVRKLMEVLLRCC